MPGVPPVPIPNTAVKPRAANGSRTIGPARVGCRQVFGPDVAKAASGPLCLLMTRSSVPQHGFLYSTNRLNQQPEQNRLFLSQSRKVGQHAKVGKFSTYI
jgi:hypothetical protein